MRVNIGLAQIYPKIGSISANLEKHLDYLERAIEAKVDLLLFPEMSLTGYQVQDLVPEVAISATEDDPVFAQLLKISERIDFTFGFVQLDKRNRYYTSQAYLSGGKCVHIHQKIYLPTYTMFDEGRYFDQGEQIRAFDTRFGRVGMLICEDFWHMSPPYLLWLDGADLLLLHSASPSRGLNAGDQLASSRWVELVNQAYASIFTNYVIHCNRVGYEDGKNFWGGSSIADPDGEFLLSGTYFDEALLVQTIDLGQINRTRGRLPLLRDERPELVLKELMRIQNKD
ncbi:MAG: carbon-nitrogen hydrolase [Anaerolineae bacterium]|jgi:predicted amidohydrolase|nr:carbon-nitrogen hydrolase [Anaerolineae bacterium]